MRIAFSVILIALIAALGYCQRKAKHSPRAIGASVAMLIASLIPPMIGNMVIIASSNRTLSTIGYYCYFLGMNMIMFALLRFTMDYCMIPKQRRKFALFVYIPLAIDAVQELCNPVFGHAFATEAVTVSGAPYYRLIPYLGQTVHRVIDYGILAAVLVIFAVKTIRSPRINSERYSVILSAMVVMTVWETAYIFSRTPIDRAMVGFGVFGLLVYYLALDYRPMRLLDSMLAHMASEMPDALFFFDANGTCIWANKLGISLVGLEADLFEPAAIRLGAMFGEYAQGDVSQKETVIDGKTRSFVLKQHNVWDDRQRLIGSFLSVRDNTIEQETLQQEIYKATHDSLTGLYNRAGYDLLLNGLDMDTTCMLLIDVDDFKRINDTYGHEIGDRVLKRLTDTIRRNFRAEDYACRLGGDEFVVFMTRADEKHRSQIISRILRINEELGRKADGLPPMSVSVGITFGGMDAQDMFERADHALYETKSRGKKGYTFCESRKVG